MNELKLNSESKLNENIVFTIRDTECNSRIFGDCEICGKPVVQVHHQIRWRKYFNKILKVESKIQVSDSYGHYSCLISAR